MIDSDREISRPDGGHIFRTYLRYLNRFHSMASTDAANLVIAEREREFLRRMQPATDNPRLIAAGPHIVLRNPEWPEFAYRVKPVFVYIQKSPESVARALIERRQRLLRENPELEYESGFGCWDQGATTRYDEQQGVWVPIEPIEAVIETMHSLMRINVDIYQQYQNHTFTYEQVQDVDRCRDVVDLIRRELGVEDVRT